MDWSILREYRGLGGAPREVKRNVRIYSPAFLLPERADLASSLECGDKVVMHSGMLRELADVMEEYASSAQPLVFEVENKAAGTRTHVGVLEFSGEQPGVAYFPSWVIASLRADDGVMVTMRLRSIPGLRFLRLEPRDADFFVVRGGVVGVGVAVGGVRHLPSSGASPSSPAHPLPRPPRCRKCASPSSRSRRHCAPTPP